MEDESFETENDFCDFNAGGVDVDQQAQDDAESFELDQLANDNEGEGDEDCFDDEDNGDCMEDQECGF